MWMLGPIGFTSPLLLLGLLALPVLWLILRAVPPAPIRRRFPGVALLLGLQDDDCQSDRTPWWLLLLRMLAAAAVIVGFSGPVLNPQSADTGTAPLLIVLDGTWASAGDWRQRQDRVAVLLEESARAGRPAAIVQRTEFAAGPPQFLSADRWSGRVAGLEPRPWRPDLAEQSRWISDIEDLRFDTVWVSDGVEASGRQELVEALSARGTLKVLQGTRPVLGLLPAQYNDGVVDLTAIRLEAGYESEIEIAAFGLDPSGVERALATIRADFEPTANIATTALSLPPELRNRVTRFEISGQRSAAAVTLADDSLRRREIALIAGREDREGLELLSPLHYLRRALQPTADLLDGDLMDLIPANPDVIVLADVATLAPTEQEALINWVDSGGMLLRFAGPRLAGSDVSRASEDPLLPVRLRAGGRSVGGAMSWGEPKALRRFSEGSPFFGLKVPDDVSVQSQVMAQPDPALSERVIAALADGTPLVTRKRSGDGQIVLFHVTANAEWSTLPLSGLFVQMLERLSVSTRAASPDASDLIGTTWTAVRVLDGFGRTRDAEDIPGVDGERLGAGTVSSDVPPGLYSDGDRGVALNVLNAQSTLSPAVWPGSVSVEPLSVPVETSLKGPALATGLGLLMADLLVSLWFSGRLRRRGSVSAVLALVLVGGVSVDPAQAQTLDEQLAIQATNEVVLAHVRTGDERLDQIAGAGLRGISNALFSRTSVEPATPVIIDLETDELAFYPLIYWPISDTQPIPSGEAYAKLNRYMRSGGMILFDTRDADIGGFGAATSAGNKLRRLAAPLDIPPLEPIPPDHVLTRTFYLLQDFPGRHAGRDVWVEAASRDAERVEGMPFRNLNDGVSPVVIGGNDWAAAWAIDDRGNYMFPVGGGRAGDRQRELAIRFGVNLTMHVLTGNYKSDQVHVPALLDRLGQ